MRGVISPTVIRAIFNDPNWHQKFIEAYGGQDGYDIEGYDEFGYDRNGVDREGNTPEAYRPIPYYEVNDDLCDMGEDRFIVTAHNYIVFTADQGVGVPTRRVSGLFLREGFSANVTYISSVDEFGMIDAEVVE